MKAIIEDTRKEKNYSVRMEALNLQLPVDGTGDAYFQFTDDDVTIQGLTVFPWDFTGWDAVKWAVKGWLGLRVPSWIRGVNLWGREDT